MKRLTFVAGVIGVLALPMVGEAVTGLPPPPQQPRFTLYQTSNMFTVLLLYTQTGRIWQAQYTLDEKGFRGAVPLSTEKLAEGESGRCTLTKTDNLWTFVLTDTENGRLWQCQFSLKDQNRGCIPMDLTPKP
jgi:hypothetical protein